MIGIAKVAGVARPAEKREEAPAAGSDRAAAAAYLASMGAELAAIARRHDFPAVAYILDMARLEAEATVQRLGSS
jgi:hypothetical protein